MRPHTLLAKIRSSLDAFATVAMIITSGSLLWMGSRTLVPPAAPIEIPDRPISLSGMSTLGSSQAPVVLIGFSDFQCPYCGRFATETLPLLKARYIDLGHVQFGFRHLPLRIHRQAEKAAEAARCADRQHMFWEFHDRLFSVPRPWTVDAISQSAMDVGIDMEAFDACVVKRADGDVLRDIAEAEALGFMSTPIFVFGRRQSDGMLRASAVLKGARKPAEFTAIIDDVRGASQ